MEETEEEIEAELKLVREAISKDKEKKVDNKDQN